MNLGRKHKERSNAVRRRRCSLTPGVSRAGRATDKGFSLFEVVLAVVILGVAGLPLALMFANASARSGDGYLISTATLLAQEKVEQILADRFSPSRGFSYIASGNYPSETPVSGYSGFSRVTTIAADSVYAGVTYRTVSVRVTNTTVGDVTVATWVTNY